MDPLIKAFEQGLESGRAAGRLEGRKSGEHSIAALSQRLGDTREQLSKALGELKQTAAERDTLREQLATERREARAFRLGRLRVFASGSIVSKGLNSLIPVDVQDTKRKARAWDEMERYFNASNVKGIARSLKGMGWKLLADHIERACAIAFPKDTAPLSEEQQS